ncbi:hypothetical protein CDD81_7671 [Ophiocordyceps australis]|uniref:Cation/H+ exchanger transmembrane domain-containing protein n=1 Tax=Ophiocordyceps australis TaxID=1399860 RepID=A0A2C5Y3J0_9HYPO|nr:hypothetical protein CDD81_7671 [Ophiocordyceps australis]
MAQQREIWGVPLQLTNFNITVALLGGFVSLFGLVSFLLKEHFYLSEALIALLVGAGFGPHGANWIRPKDYAGCHEHGVSAVECADMLDALTLNFCRLVLGVQLVLAGVQLPSKYLRREWRSLMLLIGPGMVCMWLATSLLVWLLAGSGSMPFLHALAVGACVTPTDPVLSAVIVKGKFADQNIAKDLQHLIVAESGTNDGLGYPFLFFALYLIKYTDPAQAMSPWLVLTWGYTILLSIVYGAIVGLLGKELLHWAEKRNYVDRESFLVFAVALALFVLGTCGLMGTDDVLACFIAGNTFTWDDWFRLQTKDDSLQPTVDMLLNVSVFLWFGAFLPWHAFELNAVPGLTTWRLAVLGLLVLALRRLPWVFAMHPWIHQIQEVRQAVFVGFFGPIGVSAIFYLYIALDFIEQHLSESKKVPRSDVEHLGETIRVVVWFLTVCSIIVHGLSIPLGTVGYLAPRTFGRVWTDSINSGTSSADTRQHRRIPLFGRWLFHNRSADVETSHRARHFAAPGAEPARQQAYIESPPSSLGHVEAQVGANAPLRPKMPLPNGQEGYGTL